MVLLEELTIDARISFVKLAKKLKVSNTLVHQRVKKMKALGILKRAIYLIDPEKFEVENTILFFECLNSSSIHICRLSVARTP